MSVNNVVFLKIDSQINIDFNVFLFFFMFSFSLLLLFLFPFPTNAADSCTVDAKMFLLKLKQTPDTSLNEKMLLYIIVCLAPRVGKMR